MLSLLLPITAVKPLKLGTPAETELITALIAGHTKALEKLYTCYSASLLGIISKIIKQEDVAEDILQETFLQIWKSISQYDASRGRLFTWMARLARNKAIDHLRSRGEINNLRNEDLENASIEINALYQVQYNPEHIGLKQLINVLSPAQMIILDLVYFKGYTQAEAAQILQIPIGTLKTRIRIAIKTLRAFF